MTDIPDVHYQEPEWKFKIQRVGVVRVPLHVPLQLATGKCVNLLVLADAFVDLPEALRGVHASRTIRSVENSVQSLGKARSHKPCKSICELASQICELLLKEHEYASESAVSLKTECSVNGQLVKVECKVSLKRGGLKKTTLALSFTGMTSCPSARALYSFYEGLAQDKSPTHTQRATLRVKLKVKGEISIPLDTLYETLKEAFSAIPTACLGRVEEYKLVKTAVTRPMFTEDVARKATWLILTRIAPMLHEHGNAVVSVESMESVHPYNLKAILKISW